MQTLLQMHKRRKTLLLTVYQKCIVRNNALFHVNNKIKTNSTLNIFYLNFRQNLDYPYADIPLFLLFQLYSINFYSINRFFQFHYFLFYSLLQSIATTEPKKNR